MRPTASVLAVLSATWACTAPAQDDTASTASDFTETASESEVGSDGDGATDDATTTGTSTDSGPDDSTDTGDLGCLNAGDCRVGEACFWSRCVPIDEVPACTPPTLSALSLPSANGRVVALDLFDLDQDGAQEIIAWIDEVGIGVLDDQQWTKSEYLVDAGPAPTIAAIDVDEDALVDVLLSHGHFNDDQVEVALGDGAANFAVQSQFEGGIEMRRAELAPGRPYVFASRYVGQGVHDGAYFRFETPEPWVDGLSQMGTRALPFALDAEHEGVSFSTSCGGSAFRVDVDEPVHEVDMTEIEVEGLVAGGSCHWMAADLDGDARGDLVAALRLSYDPDQQYTLLNVFANQTEADSGPPILLTTQQARILHEQLVGIGADLDGDGDDEILLARAGLEGGGTLVWSEGDQPLDCAASIAEVPREVMGARAGDLDGDGDDEVALFMQNGALRVLDAGPP
jgi:hypothetical protein